MKMTSKLGRLLILCALSFGLASAALAQTGTRDETNIEDIPPDVRLLIDISGSMKANDPANLRRPALELLLQLLPEGSKAGVWTFGQNINMLIPHRPVTEAWKARAGAQIDKINSVGLYTNIGEALEKSAYDLDRANPDFKTSIILLTDGLVDISKDPAVNEAEWQRIADELLPKFQQANYKIHTISLSDKADKELMTKLALSTDGMVAVANNADELMKIFLKVFDQAAPVEQLPLEENRFAVDSSVEEFTALIFREPGSPATVLRSPDRSEYSLVKEDIDVNWYRTDSYDLITVKRPIEGEWIVMADVAPDSRVTVVSDLNLLVKPLKGNLFVEERLPLSMLLREEGKTVTRGEFLGLLDIGVTVTRKEDGEVWQQSLSDGLPPGDGIFNATLDMFQEEGHYDLKLVLDGKSFVREFNHSVAVRKAFGVDVDKGFDAGAALYTVNVTAFDQNLNIDRTKVVARVKNPEGRSSIKPFTLTKQDSWQLQIRPDIEGVYKLNIRISAIDKQGERYDEMPDVISLRFPDGNDPFAATPAPIEDEFSQEPDVQPDPLSEPESEPEAKEEPEQESDSEEEPATEEESAAEEEPAEEDSSWILYTGLGLGNLVIILLAFFAYRMIMGGKKGDSLSDLEKTMDEAMNELEEEPKSEPEPALEEEKPAPAMDEVADLAEPESEPEPKLEMPGDDALADALMSESLDLSQETVVESGLDELSLDAGSEAPSEEAAEPAAPEEDDDDDDVGAFSLDDFAPESFDEDGDK